MTMVGGFDVHRKQITFDYVDDDGLVRVGEIRPATRTTLRHWLSEHCPAGDAEFALEGCTGWRYVVDELAAAGLGVHLGDPAETASCGVAKRAKTDRAGGLHRMAVCGRRAGHGGGGGAFGGSGRDRDVAGSEEARQD